MSIDNLLEYQRIDMERIKLESDFSSSDISKEYNICRQNVSTASKVIGKLNTDADDMIRLMDSLIAQYEKAVVDLSEAEGYLEHISDVKEADFYSRNADKLTQSITQLSKDIGALSQKIAEARSQYVKAMNVGTEFRKKGREAEEGYTKALIGVKDQISVLRGKMDEQEKHIDEKYLAVYKRLRQNSKNAIVVPLHGTNCGGCFMDLPGNLLGKLLEHGDAIDCPNCSRIIYKD